MWSLALAIALAQPIPPHIVLISMDTTRADALSCYGTVPDAPEGRPPTTPVADGLAESGVRFEQFLAHAPTTLSSHASMLTGHDPHGHAVVRNGYPLAADQTTLAERLRDAGWDTIAVVGSTAMESAMGLDQGFRIYDDQVSTLSGRQYQDRADGVVSRSLAAADTRNTEQPLFLFVHFFDAHMPYDAPGDWRDRYTDDAYSGPWRAQIQSPVKTLIRDIQTGQADPAHQRYITGRYLGEVAYVDHQIGRLLDGLRQRGLLDNAVVVLTADHGETLTEQPHFAWSHGSDVGLGALRVPLIVRGYGVPIAQGRVTSNPAGMNGLAPTIERLAGLDPTLGSGFDFYDALRPGPVDPTSGWPGRPVRPVFVEATRPLHLEPPTGWNNRTFFRGVWAGGWGAYSAPVYDEDTTFYDTQTRPGALPMIAVLEALMHEWDRTAPPHQEPSPGPRTLDALRALGYLEDE